MTGSDPEAATNAAAPVKGDQEWVCLGVITRPKGVRGQVRITSYTGRPDDLVAYGPLFAGPGGRVMEVAVREILKGGVVVAVIAGVTDRDGAEALRGVELHVPRQALPETDGDEYYHADLVGLQVEGVNGVIIGSVAALHNFGAGDILEVMSGDGDSFMVPFTRDAVTEIDIGGGRVVVSPPSETTAEDETSAGKDEP